MAYQIITPKQSWSEKLHLFSPQVKAALIGAGVTLLLAAIGGWIQFESYAKANSRLKQDLNSNEWLTRSNNLLSQIQLATFDSYRVENEKLSRQIAGIEAERDPAAKAVKKRATNLADQVFGFLQEWRKGEPDHNHLNEAWRKGSGEDFSKAFMENADKNMAHATAMGVEFARRYMGRLATTRDQLADLGIQSATLDRLIADKIRTRLDVQAIAEQLQKLAEKVRE